MPISKAQLARYPKDWKLRSRFVRFYRARNRCEWCGVPNYGVGFWVNDVFILARGSVYYDHMQYARSYQEAREAATFLSEWDGEKYIVIVLTVAHVYDKSPEAASLLNLAALCQRCHLNHDAADRLANRRRDKDQLNLCLE